MTRQSVQTAINEGIPFVIKMADGEKHEVTDKNRIALGKTYVIVVDGHDLPRRLPLLAMTGINHNNPPSKKKQ
jgi:hypothetical protein